MKLALAGLMTLALVGCGDWGHGKDDVVAKCKEYTTESACTADELCKWKYADADSAPRCKAK